ncbi:hypothetical protein JTB14_011980 [Gonioctena quinquepunctata]|nr:hypothetical protein JTB14_011980 [Gonioctena quinquepunctata]
MLQMLVNEEKPSVICLQETNFTEKRRYNMKHYDSVHKTRNNQIRASGGVTIYTKNFLEAKEIPLLTDYEAIAVILSIPQKMCICNIYIPPDAEININDLDNLIRQLPKPCVILGDFNAHNTIWGCSSTNPRGSKLETFINTSNLILLNSGEITRINTATGNHSALDLALCHPNLSSTLTWTVWQRSFSYYSWSRCTRYAAYISSQLAAKKC